MPTNNKIEKIEPLIC